MNDGIFMIMKSGYADNSKLTENIKAFSKSVSLCVPDFHVIYEIMIMKEGFKVSSLFNPQHDQLFSNQNHVDLCLRSEKSVLVVAKPL
jgi:dynein heavy chain